MGNLESFENLELLNLTGSRFSGSPEIPTLPKLKWLSLSETKLNDLHGIRNLANLQTLFLDGSSVSDVSDVAQLKKIEFLSLDYTRVSELSPIFSLPNLKFFSCAGLGLEESQMSHLRLNLPPKCDLANDWRSN